MGERTSKGLMMGKQRGRSRRVKKDSTICGIGVSSLICIIVSSIVSFETYLDRPTHSFWGSVFIKSPSKLMLVRVFYLFFSS